jgi:DNA-binding transcriptional MerR regulator
MEDKKDPKPDLPDKFYFKIGEVSRIAAVPAYVLRFWETEFQRIKPKRTTAGQRLYRKTDVELILEIKHLLHHRKFTIQGAKRHLNAPANAADYPETRRLLTEIRMELQAIRAILK